MKKKNEYKYNAFISYRHTDLDKFVAENLHKLIETYKMPIPVIEKYNIKDNNIRRIFRDQEELPLSPNLENPIVEALKESEFLIVICSPRIKESLWCRKEIENFIKYHGRNNILCVLIEGEPQDSFPEELLSYKEKTKNKSGKTITKTVHCEPLAMDVRGENKREIYKKLKTEVIRIMAPLYKLDYDDIKRRHEERELKRKARIFKIIAIASIIFAIYSFMLFSKIYISSNKLKYDQSVSLADQAHKLLAKDDRNGAVEKAYQSITKNNNIKMPVTSQGLQELTSSLGLYNIQASTYNAISQLDTLGVVKHIKTDKKGKYLLSFDESGELILWDIKKEKQISKDNVDFAYVERSFTFVEEKGYAYININREITIKDFNGKIIKTIKTDFYPSSLNSSKNGKYLEVAGDNKINIYDTEKYEVEASYEISEGTQFEGSQYFDNNEENIIFATTKENASQEYNNIKVYTYNIKEKKITSEIKIDARYFEKVIFDNETAVIASKKFIELFHQNGIITNYDYKTGKINYQKEYDNRTIRDIETTSSEKTETSLLVMAGYNAELYDFKTGNTKVTVEAMDEVVYVRPVDGTYIVFTRKGDVIWIKNTDTKYSLIPNLAGAGYFLLSLNNYEQFIYTSIGYLGYASQENRIIIYSKLKNEDYKETEYKEKEFAKMEYNEEKKIKEKYNFKNKDLINKMFYSKDKKLLFVVYKHGLLEVYNTKTKEKINKKNYSINKWTDIFVAQTKKGEYIIKFNGGGYILNKNFEITTYVSNLYDYKDGYIIIKDGKKFYKIKKYSEKEILNKAKKYLKSKGKL